MLSNFNIFILDIPFVHLHRFVQQIINSFFLYPYSLSSTLFKNKSVNSFLIKSPIGFNRGLNHTSYMTHIAFCEDTVHLLSECCSTPLRSSLLHICYRAKASYTPPPTLLQQQKPVLCWPTTDCRHVWPITGVLAAALYHHPAVIHEAGIYCWGVEAPGVYTSRRSLSW